MTPLLHEMWKESCRKSKGVVRFLKCILRVAKENIYERQNRDSVTDKGKKEKVSGRWWAPAARNNCTSYLQQVQSSENLTLFFL